MLRVASQNLTSVRKESLDKVISWKHYKKISVAFTRNNNANIKYYQEAVIESAREFIILKFVM